MSAPERLSAWGGLPIEPVTFAEDRSMAVPPAHLVRTSYVAIEQVTMACRERMTPGDVKGAYEKLLQLNGAQPWPSPRGHWNGERFVIVDGRHQYIASLMLGLTHVLVAWVEDPRVVQPANCNGAGGRDGGAA